ncbi:hypothetical protein [Chitinophaga niabensis]|uniref:Uncharacterized protein n=1 Tax=Chitinophaga niabensis TaxID=536979 RepID=A0A1N6KBE9_9BACT|nr:hypothetical protein [Chitinophaga niabensis]SIO53885.1 hypothetical protein SAMN04488055_5498 [Chitinophaga niabensis]
MKKNAIKSRNSNEPTEYYKAGDIFTIPGIGEFPSSLQTLWEEDDEVRRTFKLSAVTADFIYYADEEEGDGNGNTVMLNKQMELVSDNYFGFNDFVGVVEKNEGLLWISDAVEYWQREEFVKPQLITPEIEDLLNELDVEKLTDKEKTVYFRYRYSGPVKYTKAEALMAVMSVELDQEDYSNQLTAITDILK